MPLAHHIVSKKKRSAAAFQGLRPRSSLSQDCDAPFGALWFLESPSSQASPHSPVPAMEDACGAPDPAVALQWASTHDAGATRLTAAASMSDCARWPDPMFTHSHPFAALLQPLQRHGIQFSSVSQAQPAETSRPMGLRGEGATSHRGFDRKSNIPKDRITISLWNTMSFSKAWNIEFLWCVCNSSA